MLTLEIVARRRFILGAAPMAQSKTLRPDWLPAVALSAALAALMLAWNPQVGDLAAQVFRTELFQHAGLAIWNGSWYGGHYTLTYSVLFPPLASLLGPQLVGTVSVVASSYLFDRLVRDRWGEAARWATLWFAAGVVTLLADGQLTFALGVAFGLAALRALQTERSAPALLAATACALSSPVAAAFLAGVLIATSGSTVDWSGLFRGWHGLGGAENGGAAPARRPPRGRDGPRGTAPLSSRGQAPRSIGPALWTASTALALTLVPNLVFPELRPVPLRLLLLHRDPALVRLGPLRHPRPARRGAPAALGDRGLPPRFGADLARAQRDRAATRFASGPSSAGRCWPLWCWRSAPGSLLGSWRCSWPAVSTGR